MPGGENYYKILGVDSNSSESEIKKAYRALSMKYHPDRNPGDRKAEEKFKEINQAYEILGDQESKKRYDLTNNNPFMSFEPNVGMRGCMNPDDIINMVFGLNVMNLNDLGNMNEEIRFPGGSARIFTNMHPSMNSFPFRNVVTKPEPILKTITITIEEAYTGCSIPINITRWVKNTQRHKTEEQETVYIDIPKGVDKNEMFIIKDKGNVVLQGDLKGDVKVTVDIKNNSPFVRDGMDLIYHKTLSLKESLCGFSFELPHVNGKTYNINNNKGSVVGNNQKKIIPKLGMIRDKITGSLMIEFIVEFPNKLEESVIDKIQELL